MRDILILGGKDMTNEELMRLYTADPDNTEDALGKLYEQNMDLIWDIARKSAKAFNCLNDTRYSQSVLEDLVSEGVLAFSEAIAGRKYDESLGKLTTYVYPFIKGAMHRWLEKNVAAVAATRQTMKYVRQVRLMYYDHGTSPAEIARELKISEADVATYLEFNKRHLSLDDLIEENEEPTADNYINIGGILEKRNATESVEYVVMTKIWLEKLPEIFDQLGKRDRFILGHFYGIYGYEKMIKAELAFRLELTIDGVYKARDAAVNHAKEVYHGSDLHLWRRAYVDTKITAAKGL